MSEIPSSIRDQVKFRDRWLCVRCACPGADLHHRRSRAVPGEHQHCTCNLVLLCRTCHRWAHHEPFLARASGFIVSKYKDDMSTTVIAATVGAMTLDCSGGFAFSR